MKKVIEKKLAKGMNNALVKKKYRYRWPINTPKKPFELRLVWLRG